MTAWPTPALVQAMAMTRTLPLKSGKGKLTRAWPWASRRTMPEKKATSSSVGGGPWMRPIPPSPPERTTPGTPCMRSMSWP